MAEWALVENGQIIELHDLLPKNWRNHSGLDKSFDNLPFLNSLGWYRVEKQFQDYDRSLYKEEGFQYEIQHNKVIESLKLI